MSWGMVAVAGVSLVGGVMSSKSADKSTRLAADSDERALQLQEIQLELGQEQFEFEKDRYNEWQSTYGPLQENLANHYETLTPDSYASVGLEAFQKEYDNKMEGLQQTFAQRGIDPSSGLAISTEAQAELGAAEQKANIRRNAESAVLSDKTSFLQIGLGQNPASSVSQAMSNNTGIAAQQANWAINKAGLDNSAANAASSAAGNAWQAAIPTVGRAIDAYNTQSTTPTISSRAYFDPNVPVGGN